MDRPPFVFCSGTSIVPAEHDFVLRIGTSLQSKADLFLCYESEGRLPSYFGRNWDALLDCLRDFAWVDQRRVTIIHEDVPLSNSPDELRIYLEVLETAVNDWKKVEKTPLAEAPGIVPYREHELLVTFPSYARQTICRALGL